ncbi:MAG: aminotransferase class I/II-fold pyridoxal phosphate-dependent enzyme [Clostridia bacterium]|nr:aminotransferase class I/II-fold pyridoxal phosphate-dependent enzyme [Clostridia bacterium]
MSFDFDTCVRRGPENLKRLLTDESVLHHGSVSLDGAEPDYPTAPVIREAVRALAENGLFGFTIPDARYRGRVRWWMQASRQVEIREDWIVPTLGTIHALASLLRLQNPDGEGALMVMPPVYNRFAQAADRLRMKVVSCPLIECDDRYRMDIPRLRQLVQQEDVRVLVVCNPHNPIGQIWTKEELRAVGEALEDSRVIIFSDEIFSDNTYGLRCPSFLELSDFHDRLVVSTSLGKSFGLTGLNHANLLIPDPDLRERFSDRRTRDHYGSMDPVAYAATVSGYTEEGLLWVRASNELCRRNILLVKETLRDVLPDARVFGGEGAYVLWLDLRRCFSSEEEMQDFLLHRAFFCGDPGSSYGAPGFLRICVATPEREMRRLMEDLRAAVESRG